MGVKMLKCFPFYRRCKERCKRQCPAEPVSRVEPKPRLMSSTSCSSDGDSSINCPEAYFSHKARLSLRHQLDSNLNAVDATY